MLRLPPKTRIAPHTIPRFTEPALHATVSHSVTADRRFEITVALIGVGGALLGALIGGLVSYRITRDQLGEQRSTAARVQRAAVYKRLLATSANARSERAALNARCKPIRLALVSRRGTVRLWTTRSNSSVRLRTRKTGALLFTRHGKLIWAAQDTHCISKFGTPLRSAQDKYRRAAADVFVYGSDRAYTAERRLAELIAPDLGVGAVRAQIGIMGTEHWTKAKDAAFDRAYVAFERVMCRELSAQPRRGCS
jgi:hypothetical protein